MKASDLMVESEPAVQEANGPAEEGSGVSPVVDGHSEEIEKHHIAPTIDHPKAEKRWTIVSNIIASTALVVSIITAAVAHQKHKDSVSTDAIENSYGIFLDLQQLTLENSEVIHMNTLPENYDVVARIVSNGAASMTSEERSRLLLKERAFALYILTIFERALYQHKQAVKFGNDDKASFLILALNYFTERLLRNPRLLYYWDPNGGGISSHLEGDTIEYYRAHVLENPGSPLQYVADQDGPFSQVVIVNDAPR